MKNLRVAKLAAALLVLADLNLVVPSALGWQRQQTPHQAQSLAQQKQQKEEARLDRSRTSDWPQANGATSGAGPKVKAASDTRMVPTDRERFYTSSYADDITEGDVTLGEDPVVRQAALDALGNMNGTVLAIDPTSGRVLAMVNQKLALAGGAQPCSTIKLSVALAALSEGIMTKETEVRLGANYEMNLTTALAHSNNQYFEALGRQLGFEKVSSYAHQYGLGELAGFNISGEQAGIYPAEEIPSKLGGVGKMCSFGEGISMTPLQLGAMVAAISNGGTLYYLQHPTSPEEVADFQPVIKRH